MASPPDIIRIPMSTESPAVLTTLLIPDEYLTTFNMLNATTEQVESLLDGFDAMTIAGVVIGGLFMLLCLCLPFYCICTKSKRGWRKRSTTSGQSTGDKVYSSSNDKRRKSAGNVYSESGYKSESDFRCASDSHSESELKSESKDNVKAQLKIENEKKRLDKNNRPVNNKSDNAKKSNDEQMGSNSTAKKESKGGQIESPNKENQTLPIGKANKGMTSIDETDIANKESDHGIGEEEGSEGENTWL